MKSIVFFTLIAGAIPAHGALLAYWNFNGLTTSTNNGTTYVPSSGSQSGTASLTVGVNSSDNAGTNRGINSFGGSATNALNSDPTGQALAIQGSSLETGSVVANNGATLTFQFSTIGFEDAVLSFATQRTGTGFNSNQVAYSTNGSTFTDFGSTYNPATSFGSGAGLQTFDLSSINTLDNVAAVYLRITLGGATNISGNNRFDNIQINATAIPEPTSAAVLGSLALLSMLRRRR